MALSHCISRNACKLYGDKLKSYIYVTALKLNTSSKGDSHDNNQDRFKYQRTTRPKRGVVTLACACGSAGIFLALSALHLHRKNTCRHITSREITYVPNTFGFGKVLAASESPNEPGQIIEGLPTYSRADVAAHNTVETKIWVTFRNGVYDITQYLQSHPGGNKILLAAGKSIEPYWNVYSAHKNEEIYEVLETLRIGNITEPDPKKERNRDDPYRLDPVRSPLLIPCCEKPFNAEPPAEILTDIFYTPNHAFFVRNHLPVPCVKTEKYALQLELPGQKTCLKYEELRKMPKKSVTATTMCAGNRRNEMIKVKPVKGLNWKAAAISNAKWSGPSLDDVLKKFKVDIDKVNSNYIVFEGMDKQPDGSPYGASIPIEIARSLKDVIIIAYEMNGAIIPRDHGYPVRVMIPGVVGARQVKWLNRIYFSSEESTSHWQRNDYKGFNPSVDWDNVNFDKSVSITELPVTSAICEPVEGTDLEKDSETVTVKGYAYSGGGRGIIRVDVSADGGKTWTEANLKPNGQTPYTSYAWTLWEVDLSLPQDADETTLVAKAVDISYNVQPDSVEGIWNLRGVLNNAWHKVNVTRGKQNKTSQQDENSKEQQEMTVEQKEKTDQQEAKK
ncbi:sulfite oxidase-like [Biomphalaria glabrata]|uniref:Sulfite oxidase n=1 Tax=Biomphalaria glabrata TaxID=6526 RepID=A0A9U8ELR4_BIOGL|nr:sulfite oxidase-like [Biomphalaria glabrata]